MIKKSLKQIVEGVLWRISARWRRHVMMEIQNRIAQTMQKDIDQMTRDAFLGISTASTATEAPVSFGKEQMDKWAQFARELEEKRKDQIYMIVVTNLELFGAGLLKCRYEEKWYLLIRSRHWSQLKSSIPERLPADPPLPYSPFSLGGIPFVEDDKLAGKILLSILKEHKAMSGKFSLN